MTFSLSNINRYHQIGPIVDLNEYERSITVNMLNVGVNVKDQILADVRPKNQYRFRDIIFRDEDVEYVANVSTYSLAFYNCSIPRSFYDGIIGIATNIKSLALGFIYNLNMRHLLSTLGRTRLEHLNMYIPVDVQDVFEIFISETKTLTKLGIYEVDRNPNVLNALISQKTINNLDIMYAVINDPTAQMLAILVQENKNITRYAFIGCTFSWETHYFLSYLGIFFFKKKMIILIFLGENHVIDWLEFKYCDYPIEFLKMALTVLAKMSSPLQWLVISVMGNILNELFELISKTTTIRWLSFTETRMYGMLFVGNLNAVADAFQNNLSITRFEYPVLLFPEEIAERIEKSVEYNRMHRQDIFDQHPIPSSLGRVTFPRSEMIPRYLEFHKEKKQREINEY